MRKFLTAAILMALIMATALTIVACGSDVAGTYKVKGDLEELKGVSLVLSDDGTFKLTATTSEDGAAASYEGTYNVDGDSITLKAESIDEVEKGTIKDGELVFKGVTWVKE